MSISNVHGHWEAANLKWNAAAPYQIKNNNDGIGYLGIGSNYIHRTTTATTDAADTKNFVYKMNKNANF